MTGIAEYGSLDALELAALVARGEVTQLELLEAAIARAEAWNPAINAIVATYYDRARKAAAAPLPAAPLPAGVFSGVPFLLKDLGALLTGTVSTGSTRLLAGTAADHNSTVVDRYLAAGLNIFGRTASPELGLAPATEPAMFGPCRNPWNLAHSAGGSSGGAAAAVAARIVPMAHATDGGGSIRIPASACGLFGLKPTRARTPNGPDVGEGWGSQSAIHCVSLSVRDSAALLDATAGPAAGDPYWAPPAAGRFLDEVGRPPGALRIALCTSPWNGQPVDPECVQAAEDAARLCESLGHRVVQARPEFDIETFRAAQRTLVAANVRASLINLARTAGKQLAPDDVEPMTWSVVELAGSLSAADYANAMTTIHRVGRIVARFFTGHDIMLTPTTCMPPPPLGLISPLNRDEQSYLLAVNRSIAFTSLFNSAGNPAMSVPLHWTASGLPVGVQFAAGFGDEATLFRLAGQLETAKPWRHRLPPGP